MKKIVISIKHSAAIAVVLCFSLITYPLLRVVSAGTGAPIDLKSKSQYRSEAVRYDSALRAVAGITTMKLETADDLKQAIALVERERSNLKLRLSKLVDLAINDSTFSAAIQKRAPDKQTAEAFAKALSASPREVLKLEGAEALKARMHRNAEADAEILKRSATRLKEAAEKIKRDSSVKTGQRFKSAEQFKLVRANSRPESQPVTVPAPVMLAQDPAGTIFVIILVIVVAVVIASLIGNLIRNFTTKEGQDEVEDCLEAADARLASCNSDAARLLVPFNVAAQAVCKANWLTDVGQCYLGVRRAS